MDRSQTEQVRDLDQLVHLVMDLLPTSSRFFSDLHGVERQTVASAQNHTFEAILTNLTSFIREDIGNWKIVGL